MLDGAQEKIVSSQVAFTYTRKRNETNRYGMPCVCAVYKTKNRIVCYIYRFQTVICRFESKFRKNRCRFWRRYMVIIKFIEIANREVQ